MANTLDTSTTQIPIPFADPIPRSRSVWGGMGDSFGIWSCRFSADGNEIVAGGDGNLFGILKFHAFSVISFLTSFEVYDLLSDSRTVKITAHDADVNSCCWADTESGNVLVSASDDTFLKVWCAFYISSFLGNSKPMMMGKGIAGLFQDKNLQVFCWAIPRALLMFLQKAMDVMSYPTVKTRHYVFGIYARCVPMPSSIKYPIANTEPTSTIGALRRVSSRHLLRGQP
jgi:hypothetical protein